MPRADPCAIAAARVPVFLLDQHQVVRPGELGTVEDIVQHTDSLGLEVVRVDLDVQFRCGGSAAYVTWVQRLLGLEPGGPLPWQGHDVFQVETADSAAELEARLRAKLNDGWGARMTATYCWPWSNPRPEGTLVPVTVDGWSKPWNLRGDRAVGDAPPSALWASADGGFEQVGCVYTAQGFEDDSNCVLLGPDLVWRSDS